VTDDLVFKPRLPEKIKRLCFKLTVRGSRLRVTVGPEEATYVVEEGDDLEVIHYGETLKVGSEEVSGSIPEAPDVEPPEQPKHRKAGSDLEGD
jgi:alpha,alpha-trehalose phosphorylase